MASADTATKASIGSTEANGLAKTPASSTALSTKAPLLPWAKRIQYGVRLWFFKFFIITLIGVLRRVRPGKIKKVAPTYTKKYPIRPTLECRVFIPRNYNAKIDSKLPLLIEIHGGGFALCDPQIDDFFCHGFANKHNFCVVSINYHKSPSYYFPDPVHDAAELTRAVLADESLPVDLSRVAIGGFSAGGNLTLAIAQLPGIKEKVQALVPIYPVVDFSGRFKGEFRPNKQGRPDMLEKTGVLFSWGYIAAGTEYTDPLLSPIYASRSQLPQRIFFVGAEYDFLCHEAECMARMLAGIDTFESAAGDGAGAVDPPKDPTDWTRNGIKWIQIPDEQHGFTHVEQKDPDAETKRKAVCEDLYKKIAEWLNEDSK